MKGIKELPLLPLQLFDKSKTFPKKRFYLSNWGNGTVNVLGRRDREDFSKEVTLSRNLRAVRRGQG